MKALLLVFLLTGCATEYPLKKAKYKNPITIEWAEKQTCYVGGKVWTQAADKECVL